jgi:GNAT superfamily N-acetyltransferase
MHSVTEAGPLDAPAMAAIQLDCWSELYGPALPGLVAGLDPAVVAQSWAQAVANSAGPSPYGVMVAVDAEAPAGSANPAAQVVGFAAWGPSVDPDGGAGVAELAGLYVAPAHQRKGHASRLLAAVAGLAPTKTGATRLTTWVYAGDYIRQRFLKSVGFDADGAQRSWRTPDGDLVDEARWSTLLTSPDGP